MEKTIEIPEGYEARIEGNKVIFVPKESEDERIRKAIIYFIKQGEIKGSTRTYSGVTEHEMIAYLERQREQFVEWSKEDEVMLNMIEYRLKDWDNIKAQHGYQDDYTKPSPIKWLESLSERFNLPPKQEWSEEDEQTFIKSVETLEYLGKFELADWLKKYKNQFLKPQNTWKPSEEQLDELLAAIEYLDINGHEDTTVLDSLYKDLKKL